jgi:hypothetical protein
MPDDGFRAFAQFLQANYGMVPKIRSRPVLSKLFPIHHSSVILSFEILRNRQIRKTAHEHNTVTSLLKDSRDSRC